ncbi:hypothetical protein FOA52_002913 [Chlamydomonas sp. UWO 241]|nr:hypothetical protein FOA52_002913 [Chlamydomonas sp. UWO 241]
MTGPPLSPAQSLSRSAPSCAPHPRTTACPSPSTELSPSSDGSLRPPQQGNPSPGRSVIFLMIGDDGLLGSDAAALAVSLILALVTLKATSLLGHFGLLSASETRKVTHIGVGVVYLLSWTLFSSRPEARYWACVAVLVPTVKVLIVGLRLLQDEELLRGMTRTKDPSELLYGPLMYGIVSSTWTVLFWKDTPVGIVGLAALYGGDGLAGLLGIRYGSARLPHNRNKTWVGTAACVFGTFTMSLLVLAVLSHLGKLGALTPAHPGMATSSQWLLLVQSIALVSLVAAAAESLDVKELDNITVPVAVSLTLMTLI